VGKSRKNEREITSRGAYATLADFKRIFSEDVNSLFLLSFLLTGTPDKAEECFVEGIGESTRKLCIQGVGTFLGATDHHSECHPVNCADG